MYICGLTAGLTDKMGQFTGLFIDWFIYGFALLILVTNLLTSVTWLIDRLID